MASETIILAGGCFWCTEAVFRDVAGVSEVESGYIGGNVPDPTYRQVCSGETGHAEAIRVRFDPEEIALADIFDIFMATHDPTQLNRQGNDIGPQYRSVIFYHNASQQAEANTIIAEMEADNTWPAPVVTAVEPVNSYYPAEQYHRDYYENNPQQPYCAMVVGPKLAKFKQTFANRLK